MQRNNPRRLGPRRSKQRGTSLEKAESQAMISHPPTITDFGIVHSVTVRFVTNAALSQKNITYQNILDTWLMNVTAVASYDVFEAVRIRKVEMWACPVSSSAQTVELTWVGNAAGLYGTNRQLSDTSVGIQPAHIRARPGAMSPQSLWQQSANDVAFQLTCPSNTIIDLSCTFRQRIGAQVAAQNASVGATVGVIVNRGLDGVAAAATQIPPVSDGYV